MFTFSLVVSAEGMLITLLFAPDTVFVPDFQKWQLGFLNVLCIFVHNLLQLCMHSYFSSI